MVAEIVSALASGVFWGLATRVPIVAWMTIASGVSSGWFSRDHPEPWWATAARAVAMGGFWSAVFVVLLGR